MSQAALPATSREPLPRQLLRAFSVAANLRALCTRPSTNFAPLDGIRGFFTPWVIAAHCLFVLGPWRFRAAVEAAPWLRAAFVAHYAIDAFFVMSGFLIAHLLMREREQRKSFGIGRFLARRALRLLPAYYAALGVCWVLVPEHKENLAFNLLYVNNFLPILEQFMPWTWSLAVEEQFYLTLPLLLWLLYRLPHFRLALLIACFLLACFVRLILVDANDFGQPIRDAVAQGLPMVDTLYTKTYSRFGSLTLGVLLAYCHHDYPAPLRWLDRQPRAALLLALAALGCIGLLATPSAPLDIPQFQFGNSWPGALLPLAVALNRYAFAAAFTCLLAIMLGSSRFARLIARPLSLGPWFPLAQLSYAAYLLHPVAIRLLQLPDHTDYASMAAFFAKSCLLTYAMALVVYLAIERPLINLRPLLVTSPPA